MLRVYHEQKTQFWLEALQEPPPHEQQEGPMPALMLLGALVPSELQLPEMPPTQPAALCHNVTGRHADVSSAYVPEPITLSMPRLLAPPPCHDQLFRNAATGLTLTGAGGGGLGDGLGGGSGLALGGGGGMRLGGVMQSGPL